MRNVCDYVISKVSLIHNHGLSPGKSRHFPSHRFVDPTSKRMLELNDKAGIPLVKSCRALVIGNGGYDRVNFGERDTRNFIAESRDSRLGVGDLKLFLIISRGCKNGILIFTMYLISMKMVV